MHGTVAGLVVSTMGGPRSPAGMLCVGGRPIPVLQSQAVRTCQLILAARGVNAGVGV